MITIDEFITALENEFDEIDPGTLTPDMPMEEAYEVSSMNLLLLMALIKTEFDLNISGEKLSSCKTVRELYSAIEDGLKA